MSLAIEIEAAPGAMRAKKAPALVALRDLRPGFVGHIVRISVPSGGSFGVSPEELERRLIEIGFTEGASVRVLHEGLFGRDPIVVMVDGTRVALRRREAAVILISTADNVAPAQ